MSMHLTDALDSGTTTLNPIRAIGDVLAVDAEGFLINPCRLDLIVEPWLAAVAAITAAYRQNLGERLHSVYVRGSVAKGMALEGVSDIDSFAVLHNQPHDVDRAWFNDQQARMAADFPFQTGVEWQCVSLQTVCEDPSAWVWPFLIKTQSVCVCGPDLAPHLPGFRPGPAPPRAGRPCPDPGGRHTRLQDRVPRLRGREGHSRLVPMDNEARGAQRL